MKELIGSDRTLASRRWLLATASALALSSALLAPAEARAAEDDERPTAWIELGGQFESELNPQTRFSSPGLDAITQQNLVSALDVQNQQFHSFGEEARLTFEPDINGWIFSAAVRYGRSQASGHGHQQTKNPYVPVHFSALGKYFNDGTQYPTNHVRFADGRTSRSETHMILDFQAGKDIGIGLFGRRSSSVVSGGIRIAQFTSRSRVDLRAEPDVQYPSPSQPVTNLTAFKSQFKYVPVRFHDYAAFESDQKSFHGIGPSFSWSSSTPLIGSRDRLEMDLELSANLAVLFGRQKVSGHHQSTTRSYYGSQWHAGNSRNRLGRFQPGPHIISGFFVSNNTGVDGYGGMTNMIRSSSDFRRSRTVVVPNIGASAALSFDYSNAKLRFGYRADFFLGAMDGGIDARKSQTLGFYGPFATISIGLGG